MTQQEIKELRESLGLSQSGLAKLLGCTQAAISQWEDNERKPDRYFQHMLRELKDRQYTPDSKLIDFPLSVKCHNLIKSVNDGLTARQAALIPLAEWKLIRNFGGKSLGEINAQLEKVGVEKIK